MAKAIYIVKFYMLQDQLPNEVISQQELYAVNRMAIFIILYYAKAYLQSAIPAAAPRVDLEFWRDMMKYRVSFRSLSFFSSQKKKLSTPIFIYGAINIMYI